MTDHGHHDPGGHELEAINTKLLFRLLISLSLVTFLAAVAVVQWFYSQRRELENQYAAEGSYLLTDYKTKMSADLEGIDRVAAGMVANPALLQAPPPPAGWIHPDDLVGGGTTPAATHSPTDAELDKPEPAKADDPLPETAQELAPTPEAEGVGKPEGATKPSEAPQPTVPADDDIPAEKADKADN